MANHFLAEKFFLISFICFAASQTLKNETGNELKWIKNFLNPIIPEYPVHFPFPPNCNETVNIDGFQFPILNYTENLVPNAPKNLTHNVTKATYLCSDPRWEDPFYLLTTADVMSSNENDTDYKLTITESKYYLKNGTQIFYVPELTYKHLFEELPEEETELEEKQKISF